jgi:hypothetical protein
MKSSWRVCGARSQPNPQPLLGSVSWRAMRITTARTAHRYSDELEQTENCAWADFRSAGLLHASSDAVGYAVTKSRCQDS